MFSYREVESAKCIHTMNYVLGTILVVIFFFEVPDLQKHQNGKACSRLCCLYKQQNDNKAKQICPYVTQMTVEGPNRSVEVYLTFSEIWMGIGKKSHQCALWVSPMEFCFVLWKMG